MFFEGAEKKFEIIVDSEINLLEVNERFWEELVAESCATILSSVKNENVKAYLLSESSLFVWKNSLLMITCGSTTLVKAVLKCIDEFKKPNIKSLIFQRKNEYLPHLQKSNFYDDVIHLKKHLNGSCFRFGKVQGNHNLLFHLDKEFQPTKEDKTTEILMYDISKEASKFLTQKLIKKDLYEFFKLKDLTPEFLIDDYLFDPFGYSLNAIYNKHYYTIHVTPQENSPYVSFETNIEDTGLIQKIINTLIGQFAPGSFDLISFNKSKEIKVSQEYFLCSHYNKTLTCGYEVDFKHIQKPIVSSEEAVSL